MGDLLRSLQTTADRRPFIGGTPEKGELPMAYRVVAVASDDGGRLAVRRGNPGERGTTDGILSSRQSGQIIGLT